jgi:hypothetical protein
VTAVDAAAAATVVAVKAVVGQKKKRSLVTQLKLLKLLIKTRNEKQRMAHLQANLVFQSLFSIKYQLLKE